MNEVDIGVLEPCESWRLESRFFPCKVGGKPSWLDLKNVPGKQDLECEYCSNPCIFLCQIYAPFEDDSKAFHRTIFIFICKSVECCRENQNGNFKVFRSQLERDNEFYPSNPPEEREDWEPDLNAEKCTKTCRVCGIAAPTHCAKCRKVNYCCRQHQTWDWKEGGHKKNCGMDNVAKDTFLFPEHEIIIESEEHSEDDILDDPEIEKKELARYETLVNSGQAGTLQSEKEIDEDLAKMANDTEDKTFSKFEKRVKKCPDQVLRYKRGGKPLYIASENKIENVPACGHCRGERQFEFQLMPQLINYLGFKDALVSLDWGILAVFTCKNSCIPKSKYVEEYIWKQDIAEPNKKLE